MVTYPRDWTTYTFDEMFQMYPNNTLSRDKLSEHGSIGNIHYGDVLIKYGAVLSEKDSIPKIKPEHESAAKAFLQQNDVIVADTAEDETVGKVVQIGDIPFPLVGGLHTIVCRPLLPTATGYLGYYMNSKEYHGQLLPYITGIKVSSVSKSSIRKTELHIPSTVEEQGAIVDAIESFDAHIANLAELIEKKKAIRDGALEDLVSGRTRLAGFTDEWRKMSLSQFTDINPKTAIPETFMYVDLESVKGIALLSPRRESAASAPSRAQRYAQKGDVFYQTVRPYQKNNYLFELDGDYVFSTGYAQLRTWNDPNFLFLLIRLDAFVNQVLDNCTGTSYPAINPKRLAEVTIFVPTDIKEQKAIADVLTAMDDEIKALDEERDKMIQIREGAMDDLLTGRVRLSV